MTFRFIEKSIFYDLPEAIVVANLDREIMKVNSAFEKLFGLNLSDCENKKTLILYETPEEFYAAGEKRFNPNAEHETEPYVVRYKRKDNSIFLGETVGVPYYDEDGQKIGFIAVIRDITERRRFDSAMFEFQLVTADENLSVEDKINKALKITADYYEMETALLCRFDDAIVTVQYAYSKTGNIHAGMQFPYKDSFCSKLLSDDSIASYKTLNHDSQTIDTNPFPRDLHNAKSYLGMKVKIEENSYGSLSYLSQSKRKNAFSQRDKDVCKVTGSWVAYTLSQKLHAENLLKQQQKAEQANEKKTQFVANISHEVRTPLNGIMGYADILANMIDDPDIKRLSQKIQSSAHSLLDILNDIVDISRMESGEFKIQRSTYNPVKLIEDAVDLFFFKAKEKNTELLIRIPDNMPTSIIGDGSRLKQVVNNIISNAVKFTHNGQVKIRLLYDQNKQELRIQIADTGIGIPDSMIEKVFEEYVQADSGITKKYGGTGLGLSICRKLVEMMDGSIQLQSKLGLGTTVIIRLPALTEAVQDENADIGLSAPGLKNSKIGEIRRNVKVLLVEDIPMNVEIASAMLFRLSCEVEVAINGHDALDKIKGNIYDLIFLDIQMPDLDGITVAKEMRKMGVETPIVALTAHIMEHEIQAFLKSGMNDYLPKPIIYEHLEQKLQCWL